MNYVQNAPIDKLLRVGHGLYGCLLAVMCSEDAKLKLLLLQTFE